MLLLVFLVVYGFPLGAILTIHNGTPYPIKVKVISTAGIPDHVAEVDPLSAKEIMTGAATGVCITKYKIWVKESGMNDYADEDSPNLEKGGLSQCGFHKHLMVTATKNQEGNFEYHMSYAGMEAGTKLGVHIHNGTDTKIKVEIKGPRIDEKHELNPGESSDFLGGRFAGYVIREYKVWVMPFGEDKYNEKPDSDIKGYWDGFNKQLRVMQETSLDGTFSYKFEAERYL